MKVFNENGDFLGEFVDAAGGICESAKDTVCSWFEMGIFLGIIGLFIAPFWAILAIIGILLLKLAIVSIKFAFKCAWWLVKLPFCLLFHHEVPEF